MSALCEGMWTLARKGLLHDRVKFLVAILGVAVSVWLVLMQAGIYFGFRQKISEIIDRSGADIWVASKGNECFDAASSLDEHLRYVVASMPGVARTERLIYAFGQFKLPSGGTQAVQVVGIEPTGSMLQPWGIAEGELQRIKEVGGIVVDRGEFDKLQISRLGDRREITGSRAKVVGLTEGNRSFTTSPFVFTDLSNARSFTRIPDGQFNFVLVKAVPGADIDTLKSRLGALPNIEAYTKAEFAMRTRNYWKSRTGVGVVLFSTAIMGVLVGVVVVGQILYNGTLERLKEYGTLKAIGAKNNLIARVIIYQALAYAAIGFVIGSALAFAARNGFFARFLTVVLSPGLLIGTAVFTAGMCMFASLLSIIKVLKLDPAMVFKG